MKFNSQFIEDRLRHAEYTEVISDEGQLFSDLRTCLTPKAMEEGVAIEFGDQRRRLDTVLGQLGVTELIWDRSKAIHIHNAIVVSGGTTSFLGLALEGIGNTPLIDVLDALQSDHWSTSDEQGMYPRIQPNADVITSKIIIANSSYEEEEKRANINQIGLVIGLSCRYRPNFANTRQHLPYFVRDNEAANGSFPRDVVSGLVAETTLGGQELVMPQRSYYLKLGTLVANEYVPTLEDVHTKHSFQVADGRVLHIGAQGAL